MTMLVDPWLVGELVFAGQRWAYHGEKSEPKVKDLDPEAIAAKAAFILLSQVVHTTASFFTRSHAGIAQLAARHCLPSLLVY